MQAGWANELRYSPTIKTAKLDDALAKEVVYGEKAAAGLLRFDPITVDANRAAWVDRWKKMIAR